MKYLAAFVIGIGLFAQSSHAIDFYYVLMKTNNMRSPSTQQWSYKLHDDRASCEKQLVAEAMKLDRHLVAKRGSQVWSYVDWSIGNTTEGLKTLILADRGFFKINDISPNISISEISETFLSFTSIATLPSSKR